MTKENKIGQVQPDFPCVLHTAILYISYLSIFISILYQVAGGQLLFQVCLTAGLFTYSLRTLERTRTLV